ncbi:MAG: uroporphyrinogen decarboxylase [Candidatus Heimdallarchaeota archaeon]|nr:MAG: uroporphyrinogen decarboxylase [Candidatus Heimdallarchaeota archaeon]
MHSHNQERGKELLFKVFKHQKVDQIPWVPFAGVHSAFLKKYTATDILTNKNRLFECLIEVNKLYHPDGQPVLFDLQVEAEILGCGLKWSDKNPPMVISHPLKNNPVVPTNLPQATDGRLPMILEVMDELKRMIGDRTALFGLTTGPLTLASHLRGTNVYLDLFQNKEFVHELLDYTTQVCQKVNDHYINAGMDVIAVVDPVVSQISPHTFEEYLTNHFQEIFHEIKRKNHFSSFFVCGDATKNLSLIAKTNPDSMFVDENIDMIKAMNIVKPKNIVLGGNIPLTTVMLFGSQQDNMKYVIKLIDDVGKDNLIIAPGCDMPYDVPPDNVIGAFQAIKEPELIKKSLTNYEIAEIDIEVELPDYKSLTKPIIEVFTIDSATCAACGYMLATALDAKKEFGDKIELTEYRFIKRENVARAKKLNIQHLPCILINGELKWSSIIPNKEELINEIKRVL